MNWQIISLYSLPVFAALVLFVLSNWQAASANQPRQYSRYAVGRYTVSVPRIHLFEFVVIALGLVVIIVGAWYIARDVQTMDHENLSGHIASKEARVPVACSHCVQRCTGHDDKGNCNSWVTDCQHTRDYDWILVTDYAEYFPAEGRIVIPRIDGQGVNEPPAFTAAYIGQPVTTLHRYRNLLRGGGDQSVFGFDQNSTLAKEIRAQGLVPPRFQSIYANWDYTPRMLIVETFDPASRPATEPWDFASGRNIPENMRTNVAYNQLLMAANAEAGPKVQANLQIVVCVSICADTYPDAVMDAWLGGAKNDVTLFIGVDTAWKPTWAAVRYGLPGEDQSEEVGQGNNALLAQTVASRVMLEIADVRDAQAVVDLLATEALAKFNRKPNKDFAHLEPGLHPTTGQIVLIYIVGFIYVVVTSFYFQWEDPFGLDA